MLRSVKEINEKNKRYKATFSDGKMVKFGQSNPTYGTFIYHGDKYLYTQHYKIK